MFVHNELGVAEVQRQTLDVVFQLATLALFNLMDNQIEHLDDWHLFTTSTSLHQADVIISVLPEDKIWFWDEQMKGSVSTHGRSSGSWKWLTRIA